MLAGPDGCRSSAGCNPALLRFWKLSTLSRAWPPSCPSSAHSGARAFLALLSTAPCSRCPPPLPTLASSTFNPVGSTAPRTPPAHGSRALHRPRARLLCAYICPPHLQGTGQKYRASVVHGRFRSVGSIAASGRVRSRRRMWHARWVLPPIACRRSRASCWSVFEATTSTTSHHRPPPFTKHHQLQQLQRRHQGRRPGSLVRDAGC